MGKRHLLHVRSSQLVDNAPKLPTSGDINYGELAINYADGNETLSLKNSANQIISFNIGKSIKSINVNNVPSTITNNVASVTISGSDVNVGTYVPVSYPQEFTAATPVSGSQTIAEAFNSVETTISAVTQELLDDEEVLEKSIIALGEAAGTIDGEYNIAYLPNTSATYISSATSLYDADNQLDEAISSLSSATSDALSGITVNGIESTTTDKNASVDISGHNITLGNYTSVEYPTDFSAATNVSGIQTVSEAINAVESTLAVLSDEMIKDEKVVSESIVQLTKSAGLNNDGEITYSADTNANYISGATSLFDADTKLDAAIKNVETDISEKADIDHTHVSSEVTIEENYQTIEYPSALESAVTVESGQTVSEAFNAVETTIDLLAQEVIDNEEVVAEAFTKMGDAAGLYGTSSQIAYQPDTNAHYISGATSLFNADVALDTALYSVASGAQNSLSSITVNGINGTTTNKNASVTISGQNISVGTYTAVTYPTPFTSATPVSGSQTLSEAFNSVETTVSALTQEVIDNELVTEKGFVSVAKALGIDEESEIEYAPNENANYIAYATSYQNADELLDAALQGLSASTHNAISNVVLNGISGTVTNRNSVLSVSGSDISVGTYTPIVYPSSFTSATNVTSSQTLNQAFSAVETTISAVTEELETKANKIPIINHGTSDLTYAITPNNHHLWGTVSALTITLAAPTDNTVVNEYIFEFTSPTTPTVLSLPSTIDWVFELIVEENKTYVISIVNNLATYLTKDMTITGDDQEVLNSKEDKSNKVQTINSSCTHIQYPSARSVYEYVEARLTALLNNQ